MDLSECFTTARSSTLTAGVQLFPRRNGHIGSLFYDPSRSSELQPVYGRVLARAMARRPRFDGTSELDSEGGFRAQFRCLYTIFLR